MRNSVMSNSRQAQNRRFSQLASKWCSADISHGESEELSALVRARNDLMDEFVAISQAHAMISRIYRDVPGSDSDRSLEQDPSTQIQSRSPALALRKASRILENECVLRRLLALAAGLILLVGGTLLYSAVRFGRGQSEVGPLADLPGSTMPAVETDGLRQVVGNEPNGEAVAHVVQRIDCGLNASRWARGDSGSYEAGDSMTIDEGVVGIRFARGAEVTIEGPAEFKFLSDNSGFLYSGRLSAKVSPSAKGFEIETPFNRLVDHGTEFGVVILGNQGAETHVFNGEVEVFSSQDGESERLYTDMAAVDRDNTQREKFVAERRKFIRIESDQAGAYSAAENKQRLGIDAHPAIWLDAATGPEQDEEGRVSVWRNRGYSSQNCDAWQVKPSLRPRISPEGANGLPALQFRGVEFMKSHPFKRGSELTLLVAVKFANSTNSSHQQIVHFDLHPNLALDRSALNRLRARRYEFWSKNRHTIITSESPVPSGELMIVGCRYSQKRSKLRAVLEWR
ncbi:FecR protein domain protein [Rhodopirellula sallentina SM41]|uniref:FecR protein domain protein n=2 Tax=Rhodopirellula TaxID=265488 RepID=M5U6M8_9BACT|nr:FecR protein domain protein [Rhodopirellula sallentina SM41]